MGTKWDVGNQQNVGTQHSPSTPQHQLCTMPNVSLCLVPPQDPHTAEMCPLGICGSDFSPTVWFTCSSCGRPTAHCLVSHLR